MVEGPESGEMPPIYPILDEEIALYEPTSKYSDGWNITMLMEKYTYPESDTINLGADLATIKLRLKLKDEVKFQWIIPAGDPDFCGIENTREEMQGAVKWAEQICTLLNCPDLFNWPVGD